MAERNQGPDEQDEVIGLDPAWPVDKQVRWLSAIARSSRKRATDLEKLGQLSEARLFLNITQRAANTLARVLGGNLPDGSVLLSRSGVARIAQDTKAKLMAAANRPLLCAECSRQLSMSWARGDDNSKGGNESPASTDAGSR